MTSLRDAAQQALEALELIDKEFKKHGRQHWPEAVKARNTAPALRAALAESREHITDGSPCWCNPETTYVDPDTGASVIVHKEPQ